MSPVWTGAHPRSRRLIWVEEWGADSPTHSPGWTDFFAAQQYSSVEEILILEHPLECLHEAKCLAEWLRPLRWTLTHGDGSLTHTHHTFQGWMGSNVFFGMMARNLPLYPSADMIQATSVAHTPHIEGLPPELLALYQMAPVVQVLWVRATRMHYFIRCHPHLTGAPP